MKAISLDKFRIATGGPTLVIAEIGVNHDGQLERAMELVAAAAACGADAVKLQIFHASSLMHYSSQFAGYQKSAVKEQTPAQMLRRYELSSGDLEQIVGEIRRLGLIPLATPFSPGDVEQIESLGLPGIKIASPDVVNWPLLKRAARSGRPLLISCGAANMDEISTAAGWLHKWKAQFAILHCISSYPTPAADAHLAWIGELATKFAVPCGFSDHTTELHAGAFAVAAGACAVEKHITYDRAAAGPDHSASFDAGQFAEYVKLIRLAERLRGQAGKRVLDIERDVRSVSRQSIVAARDIAAGTVIAEDDLTVQRPGTGISAAEMPSIIGRRTALAIKAGQMLTWQNISNAAA
jgi:N,N'-diacetyllegionaminate synthase